VTTLEPILRAGAVEAVSDQLHEQLVSGNWSSGDRIPGEYDLASRLAGSRPAVREAIRARSHIGGLEVRRGDGTYVRSAADPRPLLRRVERSTLRDVFELQHAYDVQAARLAARRRTEDDLLRLHALLEDRDAARDPAEFGTADALFHLGVAEASHNALLVEAFRYFQSRLRESLSAVRLDRDVPDAGPAAHRAVVDAIAARDPDAAGHAAEGVIVPTILALEALL